MTSPSTNTQWQRSAVVCAMSVALLVAGCHMTNPYKPTDSAEASQAAASLTSLPSLEDTKTQTEAAIVELARQITAFVPTMHWDWLHEDSRVGRQLTGRHHGNHAQRRAEQP